MYPHNQTLQCRFQPPILEPQISAVCLVVILESEVHKKSTNEQCERLEQTWLNTMDKAVYSSLSIPVRYSGMQAQNSRTMPPSAPLKLQTLKCSDQFCKKQQDYTRKYHLLREIKDTPKKIKTCYIKL